MPLPLPDQFTEHFGHHSKTEVKNFLLVAASIFESETTNLNKAKKKVGRLTGKTTTQPDSNYKRLLRFFRITDKEEFVKSILCLCCCMLDSKFKVRYLALDGTSWELGDKNIHLLTLSVVYHGVSIPIWWEELDKKGTSNFKERKKVIRNVSKFLCLKGLILLVDREYIGSKWFKYLKNKGIGFVIRLKESTYKKYIDAKSGVGQGKNKMQQSRYIGLQRMAHMKRYKSSGASKRFCMEGYKYTFVVFKNPKSSAKEKLLYFISSLTQSKEIVQIYPIRWTIETCFKHLKSNGFNLEEIGFKNTAKIMLMMGIVVFLYVLCITQGLKRLMKKKKSDWKKYSNGKSFLSESIFLKGLAYINAEFWNLVGFIEYLNRELADKKLLFLQNVQ